MVVILTCTYALPWRIASYLQNMSMAPTEEEVLCGSHDPVPSVPRAQMTESSWHLTQKQLNHQLTYNLHHRLEWH